MAVIVSAYRTPIGKIGGFLAGYSPANLLATLMSNNLSSIGYGPEVVEHVIIGQAFPERAVMDVTRAAAKEAGLPERVSSSSVRQACGSGMLAVHYAYMAIMSGQAEVVMCGGIEQMTAVAQSEASVDAFDRKSGAETVAQSEAYLAEKYRIGPDERELYAAESLSRARVAIDAGRFDDEVVPIQYFSDRSETRLIATDEIPEQEHGVAGAYPFADGAAVLLMMKEERAAQLGLYPLVRLRGIGMAGVSPQEAGLGPLAASVKALAQAGLSLQQVELIELHERYPIGNIAVLREWGISAERVNVNGGSLALGDPVGCSGARMIVTLAHEMKKRRARYGLAATGISGGQGIATVLENCGLP